MNLSQAASGRHRRCHDGLLGAGARRARRVRALPRRHGRLDAAEGRAHGGAPAVRGAGRRHGHGLGPGQPRARRALPAAARWSASTSTRRWSRWRASATSCRTCRSSRATSRSRCFRRGSLDGIFDSSVLHHVTSFSGYHHENAADALAAQVGQLAATACWWCATSSIRARARCCSTCPPTTATTRDDPRRCSTAALLERFAREFRSLLADARVPARARGPAAAARRAGAATGSRTSTPPSSCCARTTAPTGRPR